MSLVETVFWVAVIGAPCLYGAYRLTRNKNTAYDAPKPSSMSFMRGYPNFIDLRNLKGGKLVKNGLIPKGSGKIDVTYKKGFNMKTDADVPRNAVLSYQGRNDFPNGLIVAYPIEDLERLGGKLSLHLLKEMQKLDAHIQHLRDEVYTLNEISEDETSSKKAKEHLIREMLLIEDIRRPLRAETDRARQAIELTQPKPDAKKEEPVGTLGLRP